VAVGPTIGRGFPGNWRRDDLDGAATPSGPGAGHVERAAVGQWGAIPAGRRKSGRASAAILACSGALALVDTLRG